MIELELTTARLRLTRLTRGHVDDLVELDSDPEVMRYLNGGVPTPRSRYEEELLDLLTAYDEQAFGFLAAETEGAFIGWFHLRPSVADATMLELGYRLRRSVWGRGIATEGSRALLRHAFETLGEPAVDACADPANVASTSVMKKCGMTCVGSFVHPRGGMLVDRYLVARAAAVLGDGPPSGPTSIGNR